MNRPIIFTYYQPIPTWNHAPLVNHWKMKWQRAGFRPLVLNRSAASRHPQFGDFLTKVRTFPTVNDRRYEEACYIRWLAFEVMLDIATDRRGIMADYDVLPQGFRAHDMGTERIICHERTRVPCMVEANKVGAGEIVQWIMSREPDHAAGHYSDMYAFKESNWSVSALCLELGEPACDRAKAIHAASGAIQRDQPGADKTEFILRRFP